MLLIAKPPKNLDVNGSLHSVCVCVGSQMSMAEGGGEKPRFFVAVHVGAGYHAPSNEKSLRSAMKRACLAAASVLTKVFSQSPILIVYPFVCFPRMLRGNSCGLSFESFLETEHSC